MRMVNVNDLKNNPSARAALATELFKDGGLSLSRAANLTEISVASFITHVSRLGVPVINQTDDEVVADMDTLDEWLEHYN